MFVVSQKSMMLTEMKYCHENGVLKYEQITNPSRKVKLQTTEGNITI